MDTTEKFYTYKETVKENLPINTLYNLLNYSKPFYKVKAI